MLVCLVHGYILFLKLRHMCDEMVKIDPGLLRGTIKRTSRYEFLLHNNSNRKDQKATSL